MSSVALVLEFARAEQASEPFAFHFARAEYLLRAEGGVFEAFVVDWNEDLINDLAALRRPGCDATVVQRVGEMLRQCLIHASFAEYERRILLAQKENQRVALTIRSAAAELYALPWELLTLRGSGQHLGALPHVLLRYEWPDGVSRVTTDDSQNEGGRILLAYSAAGGPVPAAEHRAAITNSIAELDDAQYGCVVLPDASCSRIVSALELAQQQKKPFAVLHLLCHGGAQNSNFGLLLDGENSDGTPVLVDAARFAQLLSPYLSTRATLRLVVLSACDSGNMGALGNQLGSVAQRLHRAGVPAVIASRFPLSVTSSSQMVEVLYRKLLRETESLETAILHARRKLVEDPTLLDWASLQYYARGDAGDDTRPISFRPFRGLLPFSAAHARYFFGRQNESAEITHKLQQLITSREPRFLLIAGASGTGKSSLVMAGAVPQLVSVAQEDTRPFRHLYCARPSAELQATLAALLQDRAREPTLFFIDQFEESFTMIDSPAMRQQLAQTLWQLATCDAGHAVIATVRVDYLGRGGELVLDESGRRLDAVGYADGHRVLVAQLSPAALRTAIIEPAHKVGLRFEDGLVERILAELASEPGVLPLLQDTLDLLWQKRRGHLLTQAAYEELGGVSGALQRRADALIDSLTEDEQSAARRLLVRLVNLFEDIALSTRRRMLLHVLRPESEPRRKSFESALSRLITARLVVTDDQGGNETVEVAHEALIRKWPRLLQWVRADQRRLQEIALVEEWLHDWRSYRTVLSGEKLDKAQQVVAQAAEDLSVDARRMVALFQKRARRYHMLAAMGVLLSTVAVLYNLFSASTFSRWQLVLHELAVISIILGLASFTRGTLTGYFLRSMQSSRGERSSKPNQKANQKPDQRAK